MKDFINNRFFEMPYNFDQKLINILSMLELSNIYSFYIPPCWEDYKSIVRNNYQDSYISLNFYNYCKHINYINNKFSNHLTLLLQQPTIIMNKENIEKYISLGFTKFIVGNVEQANIIKNIDTNIEVIGSITMHINQKQLLNNYNIYKFLFNGFVLDFSFNKSLDKIQALPSDYMYILLLNSFCNINCSGNQHWFNKDNKNIVPCPGLYLKDSYDFSTTCLIRPMDLKFFDPYITIYKLQDRGWSTTNILFDYFLYNSDFSIYPNIIYDQNLYKIKNG